MPTKKKPTKPVDLGLCLRCAHPVNLHSAQGRLRKCHLCQATRKPSRQCAGLRV